MVFSLFFGKLAKMPSDGIPYLRLRGAERNFSNGLTQSSNSLAGSAN
jgi:lipopolysaccharide transport system permease protein